MAKKTRDKSSPETIPWPRPPWFALAAVLILLVAAGYFLLPRKSDDSVAPIEMRFSEPRAAVYMPAEFEPQDDLLLGGVQLAELHPTVMADIVRAAADDIRIRILAGSTAGREQIVSVLNANNLNPDSVDLLEFPVLTMWVRDFGPVTISDGAGHRSLVDFYYRERRGNELDDGVPGHLAGIMGLDLQASPLLVEGGDFLTNGRGLCLLSTRVLNRNAHYLMREPESTVKDLGGILGFENLFMVPPLEGESTGHVDMFCTFLETDLVVVGRYDPAVDPGNAAQLDQVANDLAGLTTLDGPVRIERVPMPDHDDGFWRTYTNLIFANEVVLVPVYPDYCPELDEVALTLYRRLLPDRRIIGIDASELIKMNGALRCISMNVPTGVLHPSDRTATP
jgi:agmatine deiminase